MTPTNGTAGGTTAHLYELIVGGAIGPVVQSCFPDLASMSVTAHSVLTGSCAGEGELRRLLDLLNSNGCAASVIYLSRPSGRATAPASPFPDRTSIS